MLERIKQGYVLQHYDPTHGVPIVYPSSNPLQMAKDFESRFIGGTIQPM